MADFPGESEVIALCAIYAAGEATEEQVGTLDAILRESEEARSLYLDYFRQTTLLTEWFATEVDPAREAPRILFSRFRLPFALPVAAAILVLLTLG
ncbi:MAG: hypothetical protein AAGJ31_07820, partial [Verrucomicrobiota bacterium]